MKINQITSIPGHFFTFPGHLNVTTSIHCTKKIFTKSLGGPWPPGPPGYATDSRMSFSSDQVTGTVFPNLNMPFLPNSEFIENIVLVVIGEAVITGHLRLSSMR